MQITKLAVEGIFAVIQQIEEQINSIKEEVSDGEEVDERILDIEFLANQIRYLLPKFKNAEETPDEKLRNYEIHLKRFKRLLKKIEEEAEGELDDSKSFHLLKDNIEMIEENIYQVKLQIVKERIDNADKMGSNKVES